MSDITKCHGRDCAIRNTCYRFTATINPEYQGWANFDINDGVCGDFYPNELCAKIEQLGGGV